MQGSPHPQGQALGQGPRGRAHTLREEEKKGMLKVSLTS